MDTDSASTEAGESVPDGLAKQVVVAAERGDRFAFAAAAERLGSLEEAQALVRSRGILRMVDRVSARSVLPLLAAGEESRAADAEPVEGEAGPRMVGHFSVFNEWTEINSFFEGHFLERIAPGAYKKTFRENRDEIKPLFQHGMDPQIGDKPLGPIAELREDETGAYYEVDLLDAPYVRDDLLPGLKAGLYGASFRFAMIREEFNQKPDPADHNPQGLPERTLKELRVFEFGPVTFPAYPSATASVRDASLEDTSSTAPASAGAETEAHLPDRDAGPISHPSPSARRVTPYTFKKKEKPSWLLS